jgi:hypothetical protein
VTVAISVKTTPLRRVAMTPFQFVESFHNLTVNDSRLGLNVIVRVTGYPKKGTEWAKDSEEIKQAGRVLGNLAAKRAKGVRGEFTIPNDPRVDPTEVFYDQGIVRAFAGRGSPDEMRDALRLSVLARQCSAQTAKAYGETWFKQDCNAFVGNYLGASPMLGIPAYAKGLLPGSGPSETPCAGILPRRPRASLTEVAPGDLILTYGSKHPRHQWRWRHIALVESISPGMPSTRTGTDKHGVDVTDAKLSIAEWGWDIAADHTTRDKDVTVLENVLQCDPAEYGIKAPVLSDLKQELKVKKVVGFVGKDPSHEKAFRLFFEGFAPGTRTHRGWHCNGVYGV